MGQGPIKDSCCLRFLLEILFLQSMQFGEDWLHPWLQSCTSQDTASLSTTGWLREGHSASDRPVLGSNLRTLVGAFGDLISLYWDLLVATLPPPGSEAHGWRQNRGVEEVTVVSKDISSTWAPGGSRRSLSLAFLVTWTSKSHFWYKPVWVEFYNPESYKLRPEGPWTLMEVLPKEGRQMLKFNKEGKWEIAPTLIFCLWLASPTVLFIRGRNWSPVT